jgi:hypothetical protein
MKILVSYARTTVVPILLWLFLMPKVGTGQQSIPERGPLFSTDVLPEFHIYLPEDTLSWLYAPENLTSYKYFHATVVVKRENEVDTFTQMAFRLRGNTSRFAKKKSFRLSWNTFVPGRKYFAMEKINLNGEHNDPSSLRAVTNFELYRQAGLIASRATHAKVFINDRYYGLYSCMENYDEEFTLSRFGTKLGNLYKCTFPADLNYLGPNPDAYKFDHGNGRAYDLRNESNIDDYSDLAYFIDRLNHATDEEFLCSMDSIFQINQYLKYLAIDVLIGNWDGPVFNMNNFYLFNNPLTGKFEYLPYDLDNTLGIDWVNRNWQNRDIYRWGHENQYRPIYERMMNNSVLRARYSYFLKNLMEMLYTNGNLSEFLRDRRDHIAKAVEEDSYKAKDYGYTYSDFRNALLEAKGGHVKYGILPFVDGRRNTALQQLENTEIAPFATNFSVGMKSNSEGLRVASDVILPHPVNKVSFCYSWDSVQWNCTELYLGEKYEYFLPFEYHYGGDIFLSAGEGKLHYYLEMKDTEGNTGYYPECGSGIFLYTPENYSLSINEFMASNGNIISDEFGEFDDWIELYNHGKDSVFLGNLYLSDKLSQPLRWKLPNRWLQSGAYLLVWADGQTQQGDLHANFSLSASGEQVVLSTLTEGNEWIIDSLTFGPQLRNISFGRYPEVTGPWGSMHPTPGGPNSDLLLNARDKSLFPMFRVYPNPFSDFLRVESTLAQGNNKVEVYSFGFQKIYEQYFFGQNQIVIPTGDWPLGVYWIRIGSNRPQQIIKF